MEEVSVNIPIRVRFAPSPTGFLHVGGARTAIFNWLFAKNNGGKFLLRIEDTDAERSKSELSEQILRSMHWLGMDSDEPPVYQSDRIERYKEVVSELVRVGKAYYAFETPEELTEKRKESEAKKIAFKYDRSSLKLDKKIVEQSINEKRPYAIRFFIPDGITEFEDMVHGKTVFNNSEIDDFVLLRSDGSPVYQIAVVVDDHDMKISHVIRGDDHLSNTPKQILLYEALEWDVPRFAHLPMILDESKKKLSKRRNTVSAEEYKIKGYLPEALFNFLTLLGFAPESNREIVSRNELIKMFTFNRVNKKSAVFDMKKLNWVNSEYIKTDDEAVIAELVRDKLIKSNLLPEETCHGISLQYLLNVIRLMKERVSTLNDFTEFGKYFFIAPESYDENGITKHWNEKIKPIFTDYFKELQSLNEWNPGKLESYLRNFAESRGIKAGEIIHILRLILTGVTISPGIFELMYTLGEKKTFSRISLFLNKN